MAAVGAKRPRSGVIFSVDEFLTENRDENMETMILGIDEAGRGPVIGTMVYTGGMIPLGAHNDLVDCGVADSKQLTEANRGKTLAKLQQLEAFEHFTVCLDAERISQDQTGRRNKNLNTLSKESAIDIIVAATMRAKGKLAAVYVDTVGKAEVYEAQLRHRFPHLKITVTSKADSKYPIVGAASIVAKTTRDALTQRIADSGLPVGSGYPSDPAASEFIRLRLHSFFGYNPTKYDFVRFHWGPIRNLLSEHCIPITFEQDLDDKESKQKKLEFTGRDPIFTDLMGLRSAV